MGKALGLARNMSVKMGCLPPELARRWVSRAGVINGPIVAISPLCAPTTALANQYRSSERQPWANRNEKVWPKGPVYFG
jgi:hypothetical protein